MMRTLKILALAGLVLAIGWYFWSSRAVTLEPGVMAPEVPVQEELQRPPVIRKGDFSIFPMASFDIKAKVLSAKRYRWGAHSGLCPVDLALGWGPMSDQSVVDQIDISQSGRWYRWRCNEPPIPIRKIETHSANMHIIPATDAVEKALKSARKGQIIRIEGYLVRVSGKNGSNWVSSTSREDTGDGACEIVYAKELVITRGG